MKAMSVPPVPPPLAQLGARRFSFYPAILNIQHNEWIYRQATWSEVLVQNAKSSQEVWVPRPYLGEISRVDEPVMIVGLLKELEYEAGAIRPVERRVIEIPRAVNESPGVRPRRAQAAPAPVVGIRLEDSPTSRVSKFVGAGVALGLVSCVLGISLYRGGLISSRVFYTPALQTDLGLTADDNYAAVIRTLGEPARERWQYDGPRAFQALSYPHRRLHVILMRRDQGAARYIGTMDWAWRPVHAVDLPGGGNSLAILRALRRF